MFLTPAAIIFIVVVSAVQYAPSKYQDGNVILDWAEGLGWLMVVFPLFVMVLVFIIQLCRLGVHASFNPTSRWGPANPEDQVGRYAHLNAGVNGDMGMTNKGFDSIGGE